MHAVINDQWLAHLNGDVLRLCSLDADLSFEGRAEAEALFSDQTARIEVDANDESAVVTYSVVLANGLELKPQEWQLTRSQATLKSEILGLVRENADLGRAAHAAESELKKTQQVLQVTVDEKERYEEVVIKRVSEILNERNKWIEKLQAKAEY